MTKILITHWHGDHVAGLIGLVQTLGNENEVSCVQLYGPKGTKEYIKHMLKSCVFDMKVKLDVYELNMKTKKVFYENDDFELAAIPVKHNTPCLGFSFKEKDIRKIDPIYLKKNKINDGPHLKTLQEGKDLTWKGRNILVSEATTLKKGRKVTYIMDTIPCKECVELSEDSDVLICEATYSSKLQEKAEEYGHMTSKDAAMIANQAQVDQLVLTHFSRRYKETNELESDAKDCFDNVICAYDFMKIKL